MPKKELSIIITSYKKTALLELCLSYLKKNTKKIDCEIIVVDSETGEKTYDLMREKFGGVKFIPNVNNVGFGALVNQGLAIAEGEYFFIINADIIIKNSAIEDLLDFIKSHPDIGLVGPKLINFDNTTQPSSFRFYSLMTILYRRTFLSRFDFAKKQLDRFLMKKERKNNQPFDCDWIMGSAMMTSRKAVERVGKLDEKYFMYFEDVDWCRRFWEKGMRVVYYPLVQVFHYHGKQSLRYKNPFWEVFFNRYTRLHIRSACRYFWKFKGKKNPREIFYQKLKKKTSFESV